MLFAEILFLECAALSALSPGAALRDLMRDIQQMRRGTAAAKAPTRRRTPRS
jgi:hypothetical protein